MEETNATLEQAAIGRFIAWNRSENNPPIPDGLEYVVYKAAIVAATSVEPVPTDNGAIERHSVGVLLGLGYLWDGTEWYLPKPSSPKARTGDYFWWVVGVVLLCVLGALTLTLPDSLFLW